MHYRLLCLLVCVLPLTGVAQEWDVPAPQKFEKTQVCLGNISHPLTVELADSQEQQARGLMQRESLGEYQGMWFRYPYQRPGYSGFWMYQTLIPLDIAYLDQQGRIVKTFTMRPCRSDDPRECRSYSPGETYWSVLEMNAGFFAEHQVRMGDQLRVAKNGSCAAENNKNSL